LQNETGYDSAIKVGGINENAIADNISPKNWMVAHEKRTRHH
jgi:hypothetical protein